MHDLVMLARSSAARGEMMKCIAVFEKPQDPPPARYGSKFFENISLRSPSSLHVWKESTVLPP